MPAKHVIKPYIEGGYYHIFNRGVEKRKIFLEERDYKVFLSYLKFYLLPKEQIIEEIKRNREQQLVEFLRLKNFFGRIKLLAFVLMPNHFHLLIYQKEKNDIERFMKSLLTRYVIYFNAKNRRIGPLFQGTYKAVLIKSEEQLLHLSRYIHLNPQEVLENGKKLVEYPWSSYPAYVKNWKVGWLVKDIILSYFEKSQGYGFGSYQGFVEGYKSEDNEEKVYRKLLIDI